MTLEEEISDTFHRNEWTWNLKGKGLVVPSPDDVLAALDEAARVLYDEPVGTQIEVGRLIIQKRHNGHDVYVYAGPFE